MRFNNIPYGFEYGAAEVTRACSDEKKGWVLISINTPKPNQTIKVYVTKTGKVRVYKNEKELTE